MIEGLRATRKGKGAMANKYEYLWVLQGQYGFGWEDLTASEVYREVRANLREYMSNEGGRYRIVKRRELRGRA